MRILLVHSFYRGSSPSGENDVVLQEAQLLENAGYKVALWDPTSPTDPSVLDKIKTGIAALLATGHDPTLLIQDFQPDLIHIHNLFPQIGTRWLARTRIPKVITLHNYRLRCASGVLFRDNRRCTDCLNGTRLSAIQHKCYQGSRAATLSVLSYQDHLQAALRKHINMTIFTSEFSKELLAPHFPSSPSIILPNYVAPLTQSAVHKEMHDASRYATPLDPYFVTVGRLSREKGVDQLIREWPRDNRLVIVGDGPLRSHLEELAAGSTIQFRGFTSTSERDAFIKKACALILPSVTPEVDPVSVAQALSVGTPCIVRSQTASANLARSCAAIRVFSDSASLDSALTELHTRQDLGRLAQHFYEDRWSAESWLRGFEDRILSPLTGRKGGSA